MTFGPSGLAQASSGFISPVDRLPSRPFDLTRDQLAGGGHQGVDFDVPTGTPVRASGSGMVSFAGETPEGLYVTISHEGNVKTTYSLGSIEVTVGVQVAHGSIIGRSGDRHPGSSPGLHFGAMIAGQNLDPMLLLAGLDDISALLEIAQTQVGSATGPLIRGGGAGLAPAVGPVTSFMPPIDNGLSPPDQPKGSSAVPPGSAALPAPLRGPVRPSQFFENASQGEGGATGDLAFDNKTGLPSFKDPKLVGEWWARLSAEEQDRFISENTKQIGHLVGIPVDVRDRANRLTLSRRIKELEAQKRRTDQLWDLAPLARMYSDYPTPMSKLSAALADKYEGLIGLTPWRRRATAFDRELLGARNLRDKLTAIARDKRNNLTEDDVFLLELDTKVAYGDGQAVVALGNPSTAEHVGIVVPGINNALHDVEGPLDNAAALRSTVFRSVSPDLGSRTSTIMWLGYDAPNGLLDAANEAEAREGAPRLVKFVDGLRAGHARPSIRRGYSTLSSRDPHISVFAHSYGSQVAGKATKLGMDVDDLALFGSPGGGARFGTELASIHRQIWKARTADDIIKVATLAPVLGQDPMDDDFGGKRISLDWDQKGHAGYYIRGSKGLRNFARILTGQYQAIEP